MTDRPIQPRASAALHFGLGLGALMLMAAAVSRPTNEALAIGQSLGLSALATQAALTAGITGLTFAVTAAARAFLYRRRGLGPQLIYGLVGLPIGFIFAFGFDAFGGVGALATGAGLYEIAVVCLGGLFVAIGAFALFATALSQFGATDISMSRRDRVMTAPAAGVWVLEGAAMVLLTLLHLRGTGAPEPLGLTLFGFLGVLVFADVALQALTWRAMDEFMRRAWGEAMAIGLVIALATGFIYAGAQALGLVPEAGVYHALTAFYGLYLAVSLLHAAVRTPELFDSPVKETCA